MVDTARSQSSAGPRRPCRACRRRLRGPALAGVQMAEGARHCARPRRAGGGALLATRAGAPTCLTSRRTAAAPPPHARSHRTDTASARCSIIEAGRDRTSTFRTC